MAKKVLIVEDSPTVRKSLETVIHTAGHKPVSASNGKEALEILEQENHGIQIIISDINMPHMDGIALIKNLAEKDIKIPTIMLTTESSADLIRKAREYGAKGWLVKPFLGEQILATIDKLALP
ncbi:response regulator [Pseudobacteriovorax antillogorgiicola]|uniref:Two-component system, chemotaxis family, response regulator CheY n=1 Tax=Pseudobacteriovorax antillogorgiicola TaxID=1513793 RepID=A0A1Y6CPL5_9BACT|nr:response regulator [Pseudobacteriovorax antillogorgiicola]TCS43625.1 two-component system chemotaxis response regulator CheY [Pseudobacteriovorax antillogorgiicola]SMF80017.1 two-component system, chemotaxis family, response regulator CheY [Pseudobacteriovorax antillogorgiicola]